ncbi:MAG: hypothetical protein IKP33_06785 [Prevotella sp.]|nr:hypothetical protein [Prevotella sp.]MBR4364619.1 hypothetical protein [Prevotella sp.]MBR6188225.1 hypothetical protein [Prevotella sp.]
MKKTYQKPAIETIMQCADDDLMVTSNGLLGDDPSNGSIDLDKINETDATSDNLSRKVWSDED